MASGLTGAGRGISPIAHLQHPHVVRPNHLDGVCRQHVDLAIASGLEVAKDKREKAVDEVVEAGRARARLVEAGETREITVRWGCGRVS